jgi:hypothetical protein
MTDEATLKVRHERHDEAIDLVMSFLSEHGAEDAFRRLIAFMVSYLGLMRGALSDKARSALSIAEKYSLKPELVDDALAARVDCWNHLKSNSQEYDFESREACGLRAVICALTTDVVDFHELTSWFLEFADGVEDHSFEVKRLIEGHFK